MKNEARNPANVGQLWDYKERSACASAKMDGKPLLLLPPSEGWRCKGGLANLVNDVTPTSSSMTFGPNWLCDTQVSTRTTPSRSIAAGHSATCKA